MLVTLCSVANHSILREVTTRVQQHILVTVNFDMRLWRFVITLVTLSHHFKILQTNNKVASAPTATNTSIA